MAYNITEKDGKKTISVFFPGQRGRSAPEGHMNFDQIVASLEADPQDTSVMSLFDIAAGVAEKFEALSERITVKDGILFLDGDPTDDVLSKQIVRFLYDGVDDYKPLVKFYENILSNPNKHSRDQLFHWLNQHKFVIDSDGYVIGYKYVGIDQDADGVVTGYKSTMSGYGIVNGVEYTNSYLPYKLGDVVTMPRHKVNHNPAQGCSYGLHVGTYAYAAGGARTVLTVRVNPRDVVSVPTDCEWAKVRCCRFEIIEINQGEYVEPLAYIGKPTPDAPVRLIPFSEWDAATAQDGDFAVIEIDPDLIDADDQLTVLPVYAEALNSPAAKLMFGTPTDDPEKDTPRIDSVTYTRHPHDLREDDDADTTFEPEDDSCSNCGEDWCDGECEEPEDDDTCSECGSHYDDCRCHQSHDW